MRRFIGASEGSSIYVTGLCLGTVLSMFLALAFRSSTAAFDGMSAYNWVAYALMQAAFLCATFVFLAVRKAHIPSVLRLGGPKNPLQLLLTPLFAIATILIFLPLASGWSSLLRLMHFGITPPSMPAYSNFGTYALSLLLMAILPAIGEEFMMRGALFSGLSTKNVWFGVFISALLFSLMHANPVQTVHQFGLGVTLALTVALTGSVWTAVLTHFFNNFISITLTAYLPQVDALYVKLGYFNWLTGAASVLVGVALLVVLLYVAYRLGEPKGKRYENSVTYEGFTIYAYSDAPAPRGFKAFGGFLKSLFTKDGRKRITAAIAECNSASPIIPEQPLIGVWLAIGVTAVYWLYAFVVGLL